MGRYFDLAEFHKQVGIKYYGFGAERLKPCFPIESELKRGHEVVAANRIAPRQRTDDGSDFMPKTHTYCASPGYCGIYKSVDAAQARNLFASHQF